jgi:cellulose synthase/poly-beta-1,6-N-acetylglucosamine synthase-like glycosyltransferase
MFSFVTNMIILYISIFLFLGYSFLIIYYWLAWRSIPEYALSAENPKTGFSVVIPARNEERNIIGCLESVCNQQYPSELVQIITVDDASSDKTWDLLRGFYPGERETHSIRLAEPDNVEFSAHKKRAIQTGIDVSHNDVIVTTDADCQHPATWLKTIASFYEEKNPAFIAAPVILQSNASLLQIFQALDFLVLQGITGASVHKKIHSMCNGANLVYEKKAFVAVGGFSGIDNIASGDDMLLMNKIRSKYPGRVHYLKSKLAIVSSLPMPTWKEFFNQRIRWTSKARLYEDKRIFWALLLVYFFNFFFLVLMVAGFRWHFLWLSAVALWVAKTIIEIPFVYSVARFFDKTFLLKYFFFLQPLHIAYTIVAGLFGQFGKYEWKGRKVR